MNAIIVYKATTDNFIPSMDCGLKKPKHWFNPEEKLVRVQFHGDINYRPELPPCFRVSVWGTDDVGLEKDFGSEADAMNLFMEIIQMKMLYIQELRNIGMYNA